MKQPATLFAFISMVVLMATVLPAQATEPETHPTPSITSDAAEQPVVVRVRATTFEAAKELSHRGLDIVTRDGDDLLILVSADQHTVLLAEGWDVRLDAEQTAMLQRSATIAASYDDYINVEETETFLQTMAERYPRLTTLVDFGNSWERVQSGGSAGYDLLALRITNQETLGPKPVFFLMAGIHARELSTPEVATRFIDYLLTNYGIDPDVTWVLDEHEVVVAPLVNPDGHKIAEQGHLHRKNTNTSFGGNCDVPSTVFSHYGVDLNRNFSFRWGTLDTPDLPPCHATFPGDEPASEPETQDLETFIRSLYPYHPQTGNGEAAPDDTSGVFITLHSYGNLVLWPWGYTTDPPPNADGLAKLGQRMAAFNGYTPGQAISLYPTSGTTDDWTYAELGIASYTFEIGTVYGECGGFMPPYECMDSGNDGHFWLRNLPALFYAAQVAGAPYTQPAGPQINTIDARSGTITDTVTITDTLVVTDTQTISDTGTITDTIIVTDTMVVTDTQTVTRTISLELDVQFDERSIPAAQAEAYIGSSPWDDDGGNPIPLQSPGNTTGPGHGWGLLMTFNTGQRHATRTTLANDEEERQLLLVRGQSAEGVWGPVNAVWVSSEIVLPDLNDDPDQPPDNPPTPKPEAHLLWLPVVQR